MYNYLNRLDHKVGLQQRCAATKRLESPPLCLIYNMVDMKANVCPPAVIWECGSDQNLCNKGSETETTRSHPNTPLLFPFTFCLLLSCFFQLFLLEKKL